MIDPDALARGLFLLTAFSLSGWLQTRWLPGAALESLRVPLDAGLHLRGRRLFGEVALRLARRTDAAVLMISHRA